VRSVQAAGFSACEGRWRSCARLRESQRGSAARGCFALGGVRAGGLRLAAHPEIERVEQGLRLAAHPEIGRVEQVGWFGG
jgi:hypothetical protein